QIHAFLLPWGREAGTIPAGVASPAGADREVGLGRATLPAGRRPGEAGVGLGYLPARAPCIMYIPRTGGPGWSCGRDREKNSSIPRQAEEWDRSIRHRLPGVLRLPGGLFGLLLDEKLADDVEGRVDPRRDDHLAVVEEADALADRRLRRYLPQQVD